MTAREAWRRMLAADQRLLRARARLRPGKRVKQSVIDAAARAHLDFERALGEASLIGNRRVA